MPGGKRCRCSSCGRPCVGHVGPTGNKCRNELEDRPVKVKFSNGVPVTPPAKTDASWQDDSKTSETKESDLSSISEDRSSDSEREDTETIVKRVVKKKLKAFGSTIDKLASSVEALLVKGLPPVPAKEPKKEIPKGVDVKSPAKPSSSVSGAFSSSVSASGASGVGASTLGATGGSSLQTTATLAKNADVNKLLSKYNESEKEFLDLQEAVNKAAVVPGEKSKKFYAINDYIT